MFRISVVRKVAIRIKEPHINKISPNCDKIKTRTDTFNVFTRKDQYCIKKNDTKLIHSQKKIKNNMSPVKKKPKANCENIADRKHIFFEKKSTSK